MPNFCAAPNCTRKSTQSDLAFFRFPRDPARCQKWVENCRRADLEDKTPDQLNKHYRLCAKHFETSMICRTSPYRTVLRDNAIPTIFDLTSHLNNPHSRHRKRIKELSEDEIRTLKQKKIEEACEQEQETNNTAQNPSAETGNQQDGNVLPLTLEEKENKEYLKSLFEILILMGKQNIPLDGHEADEVPEGLFAPDNFQALLECRINSGEEVLRKRFETTAVNTLFCSKAQQRQMLEICESCIREETLREVRDSHFFSIITDDVVDIAGEEQLPVLNSEERGKELKEICHSQWTGRHDAFEVLVDLLQALVLCLDGINSDTSIRWNNCVAGRAFVLCSAVTDFDFIVTIVVLKNVLSFTRAFGKNLQGQTSDVFFAASSLTAVLHSLNEVMENIEVYHEFWFEEATNLATKLDVQMKLPGKFRRAQQGNVESQLTSESYYKDTLSVPTVEHIIQELKDIFSEQHLKALKCLSLVPSVMGQLKFNTSEEHHADMYRSDLPNPDTLSAELHCWRIKWKHRGKDIELPSTIYEALHLPDIKFFPNVYALLKVLCILPVMKVENERYENGRKRLKAYLRNTLTDQRSSNLALLNINFDIKHDLDLMVDTYIKLYTNKPELPTNNSETIENA
ncbi:52 kDa repressor of the inhibitor of the protein kinase-like isoform X2 [Microtus oregoni]|uniref:52 kDa repressor of the inhibitor of the protein kinase-like isoform X2 n=1 Tax=Microtus oregoni TaxID=111838 RepID=UPI001BB1A595|nr:52 kDa repressor of the inhibitor of the protein kinase-like isoform X2 [Microtus oregoni]